MASGLYARLVDSQDGLNVGADSPDKRVSLFDYLGTADFNAYTRCTKSYENQLAEHTPSGSAFLVITFVVYFDNIGTFNLNNLARGQIYSKHAFCD